MKPQHFLPCYDLQTKKILGVLTLTGNVQFVGDETTYALPSGKVCNVQRIVPEPSIHRAQNPDYMAAIFTRYEVKLEAHRGFPEFLALSDLPGGNIMPNTWWNSPGGIPNLLHHDDGVVLKGLKDTWAV